MRRPALYVQLFILVFLSQVTTSWAVDVDTLIRRHIDARGGYENLKAIETLKIQERAVLGDSEIFVTIYYKRPFLYRVEQVLPEGEVMVRVVNDKGAWVKMGSESPMQRPSFAARHQRESDADMDGILVDCEDKGHQVELTGEANVNGVPTYELRVTLASGAEQQIYIDKRSHLIRKQVRKVLTPQGNITVANVYSDYRDVDGLMVPFRFESDQGGQSVRFEVTAVEPNVPLDNALFQMEEEQPPFTSLEGLDRYLQEEAANNRFSGVVLVAQDWHPAFHKAYGYSNKRSQTPNKVDTKFNIGSINKMFTSVAILQLAEKGLLDLDDTLHKHLPYFPSDVATRVTIRHLLQHRSGWGAYWDNKTFLAKRTELRTIDDYMAFIKDIPLDFEPGARQQYSNTGYEVLGAVIEKVSGESYYDYVRKHIFEPTGMHDTDAYEIHPSVENLAIGYTNHVGFDDDRRDGDSYERENTSMKPLRGTAAGGGYSTAKDLLRFIVDFRNHRLLSPRSTAVMMNEFEDVASVADEPSGAVAFAGGAPGINASCFVDYGRGDVAIVLSNYDPPVAEELERKIARMLRQ